MNPLTKDWDTPFGMPPFEAIETEHFEPAFDAALSLARNEIDAVAGDCRAPDFENTIAALERSGALLERVAALFFNLAAANADPEIEALQRKLSPVLARHRTETIMNTALFGRIETLMAQRETLGLAPEQDRILDLYHRSFVRAGAGLKGPDRARFGDIAAQLASLGTEFSQNVLADERSWEMRLQPHELEGLPDWLVEAAAEAAAERGHEGHVITLSRSLIVPFLECSPRRELRERAFQAWADRGRRPGATDNRALIREMLALRAEQASLLGYKSYADFKLETEMAGDPDTVRDLLMAVWRPARAQAEADGDTFAERMQADGINGPVEPWDWRYYAAARRRDEFAFDESDLKPYLPLNAVRAAAFDVAGRLFDLSFEPAAISLYHPDARAWEVSQGGRHLGIFVADDFARPSKRSGAWCSSLRVQQRLEGDVRPIAVNVCNFAKAPAGSPCLLTFDDARTLFHEFGHALHVLMSDVTFPRISGTRVERDFVEVPSQLYENWLLVPEVLHKHARHFETAAPMPQALVERLLSVRNFDQGFATVEYLASALVDLDLHEGAPPQDALAAEKATLERIGLPDAIVPRHGAAHFQHVFAGDGYSAGYYSYLWSEVMDADAFAAFEEAGGPFDRDVAARLAETILCSGGSRRARDLYLAFRGRMPGVEALLGKRGLTLP